MIVASKYNVYQNIFSRMKAMEAACRGPRLQGGNNCSNINSIDKEQAEHKLKHQQHFNICQQEDNIKDLFYSQQQEGSQNQKLERTDNNDYLYGKRSEATNNIVKKSVEAEHYACKSLGGSNCHCPQQQKHYQKTQEAAIKQHQQHHILFNLFLQLDLKPSSLKCLVKYFGWLHIRTV